jgi:dCTP deaminase
MSSLEHGCVLSDTDIIDELGKNVIIEPFNRQQLCSSTYDVRLGKYFYRSNPNKTMKYLQPENGKHIVEYWNINSDPEKNYGAIEATKVTSQEEADLYGVEIGDEVIVIQPGELILGHTIEFIGGRNNVTTMIKARSTMGRCGVTICCCAGMGDPGFFSIWALEIKNNITVPVVLKVGQRVGQILFLRTGKIINQYDVKGNYQTSNNLEDVMKTWSPLNMIPSSGAKLIRALNEKKKEQEQE